MGIMPQTFVHEAVHAVQSCKTGKMKPLGYQPPLDYAIDRAVFNNLYRNYDTGEIRILSVKPLPFRLNPIESS